jgi:hypothetical protein
LAKKSAQTLDAGKGRDVTIVDIMGLDRPQAQPNGEYQSFGNHQTTEILESTMISIIANIV